MQICIGINSVVGKISERLRNEIFYAVMIAILPKNMYIRAFLTHESAVYLTSRGLSGRIILRYVTRHAAG